MRTGTRSRFGFFGVPRGAGNTFNRGESVVVVNEKSFAAAYDAAVTTATAYDARVTIAEAFNE